MKDADVKIRLMYEEAGRGDVMKNLASIQAEIARLDSSIAKLKTTEKDQSDQTVTDKARELGILEKLEQQWTDVFVKMRQATTVQDVAKYRTELEGLEKQIKDLNGGVEKATTVNKGFAGSLGGLAGLLAAAFSVDAIKDFTQKVFTLTAGYESNVAALTNVLGSHKAAIDAMKMLQKYADQTNFTMSELSDGFIKMANRGIAVGKKELASIGDVANTLKKPFQDVVEAILDVNNTERWTELGIKAKTEGDKVVLSFKGMTLSVNRTEEAVTQAMVAFGQMNGVTGQTAAQAETLSGKYSTMQDSFDGLFRAIGTHGTSTFRGLIELGTSLANTLTTIVKESGPVVSAFGNMFDTFKKYSTGFLTATGNILQALGFFKGQTIEVKDVMTVLGYSIEKFAVLPLKTLYTSFLTILNYVPSVINGAKAIQSAFKFDFSAAVSNFDAFKNSLSEGTATNKLLWADLGQTIVKVSSYTSYVKSNQDEYNKKLAVGREEINKLYEGEERRYELAKYNLEQNNQLTATQKKNLEAYVKQYEAAHESIKKTASSLIIDENKRWLAISSNMKKGSKEYETAYKEHIDRVENIINNGTAKAIQAEKDLGEKRKKQAKLTANEVALIELKSNEDSLANRIKIIEKQADIEIAQINKTAKNKAEAADKINAIVAKKEEEITRVRLEYNEKVTTAINNLQDVLVEHRRKTGIELVGIDDEITRHFLDNKATEVDFNSKAMKAIERETQKNIDELKKIEEEGYKARQKAQIEFVNSITKDIPVVGQIFNFATFESNLKKSRETLASAEGNLVTAKSAFEMAESIFGSASTKTKIAKEKYTEAQVDVAKASNENVENEAKNAQATFNIWMAVVQAIFNAFSGMYADRAKRNAELIALNTRLKDSIVEVYKTALDASKENMNKELDMFKGNYEKQKEILSRYLDQQKGLYESKSTYELQINQINRMLEGEKRLNEERSKSFDSAFSWKSLTGQEAKDSALQAAEIVARYYDNIKMMSQKRINDLKFEAEAKAQEHQLELQYIQEQRDAFVDAKNAEIDKVNEVIGAQIDALKTQRDAAKDAIQAQIDDNKNKRDEDLSNARAYYSTLLDEARSKYDAEKEALRSLYDEKRRLLEESTALEIQKVEILDSVRNAALDRWQVTEVKKYESERDRILATLTDEAEKQQVIDFYAQKIADVHSQYEDAKLNKSKAINLATMQIKQEEKDETEKLKTQEIQKLKELEDSYNTKVKDLADDRDKKLKEISDNADKREKDLRTSMQKQAEDYETKIKNLENSLASTVKDLKAQIANKDIEMNNSMKEENRKYQEYVRRTNKELFTATIQMKVAEMKAEIAMLEGQRTIWNSGKISEQQDRIKMAINELQSISNPYYSIQDSPAYVASSQIKGVLEASGAGVPTGGQSPANNQQTVPEGFVEGAQVLQDYNSNSAYANSSGQTGADGHEQAMGMARMKDGNISNFFEFRDINGTQYYRTIAAFADGGYVWGNGYPDGVDTVPAMVSKGEFVLNEAQTKAVGGANTSGEALVSAWQYWKNSDVTRSVVPMTSKAVPQVESSMMSANFQLDPELKKLMVGMKEALENQQQNEHHYDEHGYWKAIRKGNAKIYADNAKFGR